MRLVHLLPPGHRRPDLRGAGLATLLFLPHIPALVAYLGSGHLGFGTSGLSKLLVLGFALLLWAEFPAAWLPRPRQWTVFLLLSAGAVWTQLAGFSAWALFLGLASLLLWRFYGLEQDPGPSAGRVTLFGSLLVAAVILLPIFQGELVGLSRAASMALVDLAVRVGSLPIERQGISFFVGSGAANQVPIWQQCSGTATTRVLFILLACHFLTQNRPRLVFIRAPFQAVTAGLLCNTARILLFLCWTLRTGAEPDDLVHQGLGIGLFGTALLGLLLLNWKSGQAPPRRPAVGLAAVPRRAPLAIASIGVLVAVLVGLRLELAKTIDHTYAVMPAPDLRPMHVNHFVEHPGGGGWVLLEHPIEVCLRARGIDIEIWQSRLDAKRERLQIDQSYRVGESSFERRSLAALTRWLRPDLWGQPLYARIRLVEPATDLHASAH